MTLQELIRGRPTIIQLTILERADRVFTDRAHRYFAGQITDAEQGILTKDLRMQEQTA